MLWFAVVGGWLLVARPTSPAPGPGPPDPSGGRAPTARQAPAGVGGTWVLCNIVGFALAGTVFGHVQRHRNQRYFEVVSSAPEAVRIETVITAESLVLFGALVGIFQWLVFRRAPYARWWVPATVLGWSLMGVFVGAMSGLAFGSVSTIGPERDGPVMLAVASAGAVVGFLPSTFQFLALRRYVDARSWPLVSLAGLGLGVVAGGLVVRWGLVDVVPG